MGTEDLQSRPTKESYDCVDRYWSINRMGEEATRNYLLESKIIHPVQKRPEPGDQ